MELPLFLIGYGSIGGKKKLTCSALGRKMDKMLFEHTRLFFSSSSSSSMSVQKGCIYIWLSRPVS